MPTFSNQEIAQLLREVAAAFAIKEEDFFRIRAYENAASSIEHFTSSAYDLWKENKLDDIPGIGPNLKQHLDELFRTGKVRHFDQERKGLSQGMFVLLNIPGIGAKTAYLLAKHLHLTNPNTAHADLLKAAQQGKIRTLEGFGKTSEEKIIHALEKGASETKEHRLLLPEAETLAQDVIAYLKSSPNVIECEVLGSLRRHVATVGDIDIAVKTHHPEKVMHHLREYKHIGRILSFGEQTAMFMHTNGKEVDVRMQSPEEWGSMLQHETGSKMHNIHLRTLALKKHLSLSEHGIKTTHGTQQYATEQAFYKVLNLEYIPPELREDTGEIEAAQKRTLPRIIELKDIKGDFHIHTLIDIATSHDSGRSSIGDLLDKARVLKYEYIGFSDHNPKLSGSSPQERFTIIQKHHDMIDRKVESYAKKHTGFASHILKGLEVDIRGDGELALEDKALELCDYVIASVHSQLNQDSDIATQRILRALEHPKVSIWGHPKGRLIQDRDGLEYDWNTVFECCTKHGVIVEVNASPLRLDLPDTLIRQAISYGVKCIINTDTHSVEHMEFMKYGVWTAARGWAEKKDVINTWGWEEVKKILKK